MNDINVVLVDDQKLFGESLADSLDNREGIRLVKYYDSSSEFIDQVRVINPDIMLIDLELDNNLYAGIELCRTVKQEMKLTGNVIIISSHSGIKDIIIEVVEKGAKGFVAKDSGIDELVAAVKEVHNGGSNIFSQTIVNTLVSKPKETFAIPKLDMTPRQSEVFTLICKGKNTQEIIDELGISIRTLEKHKADIRLRLDIEKDIDFLLFAIKNKLPEIIKFLNIKLI